MGDETKNVITTAIQATTELSKAVPLYQDALQPAAKELGKSLQVIAKTVNMALAPLSTLVWGYEQISEYLGARLTQILSGTQPEQIKTPDPNVACPVVERLRLTAEQPDLREMYAKLLATAMHAETASTAHPAFVEAIKQMTADEAKMLLLIADSRFAPQPLVNLMFKIGLEDFKSGSYFTTKRGITLLPFDAGCSSPEYGPTYVENFARLGIVRIEEEWAMPDESYAELLSASVVTSHMEKQIDGLEPGTTCGRLFVTEFGQLFIDACLLEPSEVAMSRHIGGLPNSPFPRKPNQPRPVYGPRPAS